MRSIVLLLVMSIGSFSIMAQDLGKAEIDGLIEKLTHHGMVKLGEHGKITPEVSREILITAL